MASRDAVGGAGGGGGALVFLDGRESNALPRDRSLRACGPSPDLQGEIRSGEVRHGPDQIGHVVDLHDDVFGEAVGRRDEDGVVFQGVVEVGQAQ
ncbi:MAG: hypothetical protein IIA44_12465, partial [Acidobacteria bacterium]|nr:hypothetical protein [Acidobacteriota bacterium]